MVGEAGILSWEEETPIYLVTVVLGIRSDKKKKKNRMARLEQIDGERLVK